MSKKYAHSFTLIEILIVLVIITIMTAVVAVATGDFGRARHEKIIIDEFKQAIVAAQRQAILTPETLSLHIDQNGYQFFENNKPLHDDVLSHKHAFKNYFSVTVLPTNPIILFLPSGDVTPFTITVSSKQLIVIVK